jgi:hypothetical protein
MDQMNLLQQVLAVIGALYLLAKLLRKLKHLRIFIRQVKGYKKDIEWSQTRLRHIETTLTEHSRQLSKLEHTHK